MTLNEHHIHDPKCDMIMYVSNTTRRRERYNVQNRPRRAGESVDAPRAGESDIGPARRRECNFEKMKKKRAATRRRELDLEVGRPPRAGESIILEHFEENAR